jgi:hypothetical protein
MDRSPNTLLDRMLARRQGMALAQQYPEAYDGIVASAPTINWPQFSIGGY